jgi:hypothetical protein
MPLVPAIHRPAREVRAVFDVADDAAALLPGPPADGREAQSTPAALVRRGPQESAANITSTPTGIGHSVTPNRPPRVGLRSCSPMLWLGGRRQVNDRHLHPSQPEVGTTSFRSTSSRLRDARPLRVSCRAGVVGRGRGLHRTQGVQPGRLACRSPGRSGPLPHGTRSRTSVVSLASPLLIGDASTRRGIPVAGIHGTTRVCGCDGIETRADVRRAARDLGR